MRCHFTFVYMYVHMYIHRLAQYNPILMYVYPLHLRNTILCSRMYFHHTCTTIAQLVAKMCLQGQLWPWTTAWPVWPVSYGRAFHVPASLTAHRVRFQ